MKVLASIFLVLFITQSILFGQIQTGAFERSFEDQGNKAEWIVTEEILDLPANRQLNLSHSNIDAWLFAFMDMDGDNDKDLIANDKSRIVWLENRGSHWGNQWQMIDSLDDRPVFMEEADIDNDGEDELLITMRGFPKLMWNDTMMVLGGISHAAAAKINGDNFMDIVAIDAWNDTMMWFQNVGDSAFIKHIISTQVQASFVLPYPVDADGSVDLILNGLGADGAHIFWNDGNGNFTPGPLLSTPFSAREELEIGDPNNDGQEDLLFYDLHGPSPDYWRIPLDSLDEDPTLLVKGVSGPGLYYDFDQNGWDDLVTYNKIQRRVYHISDLEFPTPQEDRTDTLQPISAFNTMDFEAFFPSFGQEMAEQMPLISWARRNNYLSSALVGYFSNDYSQGFDFVERGIAFRPKELQQVEIADLDADGDLDLIATDAGPQTNNLGHRLLVWENIDGTHFMPWTLADDIRGIYAVHAADLDNDNHLDLLVSAKDGEKVLWLRNPGNGQFYDWPQFLKKDSIGHVVDLLTADLENDNSPDAVWCSPEKNQLWVYPDIGSPVPMFSSSLNQLLEAPRAVAKGDFNKDGLMDLVAAGEYPTGTGAIAIYLNQPNSNQFTETILYQGKIAVDLEVGDWNRDGWEDIFAALYTSQLGVQDPGDVIAFMNNSTFSWNDTMMVAINEKTSAIGLKDMNHDGYLELVYTAKIGNADYLRIIGDTILDEILLPSNSFISDLEIADVNNDSLSEVYFANRIWSQLRLYYPQAESFPIKQDTTQTTSILDPFPDRFLTVYPNPANEFLNVDLPDGNWHKIQLIDMTGKTVFSQEITDSDNTLKIPVESLTTGMYFISIHSETNPKYAKIWVR